MRKFMTGLLVSAAFGVYAQQPGYYLADFRILPEKKVVYKCPLPGSAYIPDEQIDYTSTELVCIGGGITFKEYVEDFDLNSFKVFSSNNSAEPYSEMVFVDKNGLYRNFYPDDSGYRSMEDLSEKARLSERIYIDKNDKSICFIDLIGNELMELENIPPNFDFKTLKPICDNFFFNKDGLYILGRTYSENPWHDEESSVNLLQKSNGKQITPKVYKHYFVYDGQVYARNLGDTAIKLELNPGKIRDLSRIIHPGLLTDGTVSYNEFYKTSSQGLERVANWKTIAEYGEFIFIADQKTNRLFMPSDISVPIYDMKLVDFSLVWDGEKYLAINSERTIETFNSLYLYNFKTKQHEEFNLSKHKRLAREVYIYDSILIRNGTPVRGQQILQLDKLRPLLIEPENVSFFTDEHYVYCMDAENTILKKVDMPTLRTINNQLMVDNNCVYSLHDAELTIFPYRSLGLNLRVIE